VNLIHRSSLILTAALGLAAPAASRSETVPSHLAQPTDSATAEEQRAVGGALRLARKQVEGSREMIVERIVSCGPGALDAAFDVLVSEQIPEFEAGDPTQILSQPQREILLLALAQFPHADLRQEIRTRIAAGDPQTALAAVRVLGAIGDARDLQRITALAPRKTDSPNALTRVASESLRAAAVSILARDPRAWIELEDVVRTTDRSAARSLLEAASARRDPRALEVLSDGARTHRDLAPLCVAGVQKVGPSIDAAVAGDFVRWMVAELPHARAEHRRGLYQAIGVLDDGSHARELIDGLTDADEPTRESALWALRKLTGLGFSTTPEPWTAWLQAETRWHERERNAHRSDLGSRDPVRVAAALRGYAGRLVSREVLAEEVAVVLGRSEPELRLLACEVLASLRAMSAIRPMASLLYAPEPSVREAAWRALGTISGLELPKDPEQAFERLHLL